MAIGVLIDTFLVRTALVPGLTLALGPVAGWPGRRWRRAPGLADDVVHAGLAQADGTE